MLLQPQSGLQGNRRMNSEPTFYSYIKLTLVANSASHRSLDVNATVYLLFLIFLIVPPPAFQQSLTVLVRAMTTIFPHAVGLFLIIYQSR